MKTEVYDMPELFKAGFARAFYNCVFDEGGGVPTYSGYKDLNKEERKLFDRGVEAGKRLGRSRRHGGLTRFFPYDD